MGSNSNAVDPQSQVGAHRRGPADPGDTVFFSPRRAGSPDASGAVEGVYTVFGQGADGGMVIRSAAGGLFTVSAKQLRPIPAGVQIAELAEVISQSIESLPHAMRLYPEAYSQLLAANVAMAMDRWAPEAAERGRLAPEDC